MTGSPFCAGNVEVKMVGGLDLPVDYASRSCNNTIGLLNLTENTLLKRRVLRLKYIVEVPGE